MRTNRLLALLLVVLVMPTISCASDSFSMFIRINAQPDDTCAVSPSSIARLSGSLDLNIANIDYDLIPVVRSNLLQRASTAPFRGETNSMYVHSAIIKITGADGQPLEFLRDGGRYLGEYTVASESIFVNAGNATSPGEGVGAMTILPRSITEALRQGLTDAGIDLLEVIVTIKPIGRTAGGVEISGLPFQWPVRLCRGCMAICTTCMNAMGVSTARGLSEAEKLLLENSCKPGQDGYPYTRSCAIPCQ